MGYAEALRRLLLRPSIWTAIVAVLAYSDRQALRGAFVYDDNGSIKSNVVVNGNVPFREVRSFLRGIFAISCCWTVNEGL